MKKLFLVLSILCLWVVGYSQNPCMMFGDTSRIGVPYSKDPHVVNFKGTYLMYYSIPPLKGDTTSGWNIGIAQSKDLNSWTKVGEITPASGADYEKKGLCAPGALVKDGKVNLFYQTYGNGKNDAICHAVSADGIHFERNPTNPIFRPTGDWTCGRAIDAEVCEFKGRFFLYFATRDKDYQIQMQGVATAPATSDFNREDWTQATDSSILFPQFPWEGKCIEGASIAQKGEKLYMFYAGSYNMHLNRLALRRVWTELSGSGCRKSRLSETENPENGIQANPAILIFLPIWTDVPICFIRETMITVKPGTSLTWKCYGRMENHI